MAKVELNELTIDVSNLTGFLYIGILDKRSKDGMRVWKHKKDIDIQSLGLVPKELLLERMMNVIEDEIWTARDRIDEGSSPTNELVGAVGLISDRLCRILHGG